MTLLATERNMTQEQYRDEVVWPMLALRRLAANQLKVSEAEIQKEMDGRFGPQVKARIIVLRSREKAEQVRRMAVATPDDFPKLAKEHSTDENSASVYGQIQPIRRHMGDPHIEQAAFALQEGQVSEVLTVGDQFVLLKCEGQIAGSRPKDSQLKQVRTAIVENIRHHKLRDAGAKLFRDLQKQAQLENIWNDEVKRKQMPGVAATLNGQAITIRELKESLH